MMPPSSSKTSNPSSFISHPSSFILHPLPLIILHQAVTINPAWALRSPVTLTIEQGEQVAIIGRNGSGKTLLAEMIAGRHPIRGKAPLYPFPPEEVAYLSFRDAYGAETERTYYLQ